MKHKIIVFVESDQRPQVSVMKDIFLKSYGISIWPHVDVVTWKWPWKVRLKRWVWNHNGIARRLIDGLRPAYEWDRGKNVPIWRRKRTGWYRPNRIVETHRKSILFLGGGEEKQ